MMIKITIILGLVCVLLGALSFVLFVVIKDNRRELKALWSDKKMLEENITYLFKHSEIIAKIKKDRKEVCDEIMACEDTDEIINIISSIIRSNNDRVQNHG